MGLNLVFVICFNMGVAGVALATIISQMVSSLLVLMCLIKTDGFVHLNLRRLRIHRDKMIDIARLGLPAGFQGACFSISNVLIQSTVNSYGSVVMAGNSASSSLEGFIYVAMNAFHQAAITFTSTNIGAGKNERIRQPMGACTVLVTAVGAVMGLFFGLFMRPLLGIYSPDPAVIDAGMIRLKIFAATYFLCGIMDVFCGMLRGMGQAVAPMVVSVMGACVFRTVWIYTVLVAFPSLNTLYLSYPISWILTLVAHFISISIIRRKMARSLSAA